MTSLPSLVHVYEPKAVPATVVLNIVILGAVNAMKIHCSAGGLTIIALFLLDGLGRSKLVRLVSLNKVQAVLSQICDYSPVSVKRSTVSSSLVRQLMFMADTSSSE